MRKGLLEKQAEGRQNQGRPEASMASLNDLIKQQENLADTLMAEMSAVMKERDRQTDECLKLMTDLMQRRKTDADARMIDLMTTMKDLTLGVRAMASQTVAAQAKAAPAAPIAPHPSDLPSTSTVPPPVQATYRKVAQPSVEQIKPLKLIPPATYKRDPPKTSKMARIHQSESRDVGTGPLTSISFDPYAHGASTTGDNYSSASGMTTRESNYHTPRTTASTNQPEQAYINLFPRPAHSANLRLNECWSKIQAKWEKPQKLRIQPPTPPGQVNGKRWQKPY